MSMKNISLVALEDGLELQYDYHGAILYMAMILLLYSLSLYCALILFLDPSDHQYEKKWSGYQMSKREQTSHSNQAEILNTLSDQALRQKYWQIYYGDNVPVHHSDKFLSEETKRLLNVSQQMRKLSHEQIKQSSQHQELDELNRISRVHTAQPSPSPSSSSFLLLFRRPRSTSVPGVYGFDRPIHHSCDLLSRTPLCTPPPTVNFLKRR